MSTDKKISVLIEQIVPAFIAEEHPNFVTFLEAYHEWLEQNKNLTEFNKNLLNHQDIDRTLDEYMSFFRKEFLSKIPDNLFVDPRNALKSQTTILATFTEGETLKGLTSGAEATFTLKDSDNLTIVAVFKKGQFIAGETVKALTSNITFALDSLNPYDFTAVDKRKLLKNIKEFYRARGTEKSFRLFFRILFNEEIDFYYPRVDMLKPSDGKWFQDVSIRTRQVSGDVFSFVGQKVRGDQSNASAFVEHVQKIQVGPLEVYEIFLNRSSIIGKFLPVEVITSDTAPGVEAETYHILTGIKITNPGQGYVVGDEIDISQVGPGYNAKARVSNVGDSGEILKTVIIDYGAGYSSGILNSEVVFPITGSPATGEAIIGGQTLYPGYFLNDDGKISDAKFIQDSYYYQQFSYVIKVSQSIETYRNLVKDLIHPAGLLMFGEFFSQNLVDVGSKVSDLQPCSFINIQRHVGYQPYALNSSYESLIAGIEDDIEVTNALVEDPNYGNDFVFNRENSAQQILPATQKLTAAEIREKAINVARTSVVPKSYRIQNYVLNCKAQIGQNVTCIIPVVDQRHIGGIQTFKLGPNLRSIEQLKFTYLPHEDTSNTTFTTPPTSVPPDDTILYGSNINYWSLYGNYQIGQFEDMVIQDFEYNPQRPINIMPEPVVHIKNV